MDKKYRKASFREGALSSETSQSKKAEVVSERAGVDPMQFRHPKIFMDVLTVYKMYYHKHEALPKIFRVTIGTEIMKEISSCLRLIVLANLKRVTKEDFADSYQSVKELRGAIELIKSYFLIGWEMKFFSHGFYIQLMTKLEEVSKQAATWSQWIKERS